MVGNRYFEYWELGSIKYVYDIIHKNYILYSVLDKKVKYVTWELKRKI